ncbi:MAG: type III-B CRISPR module-associated protein Cmr5 [Rhodothermales bacterium]
MNKTMDQHRADWAWTQTEQTQNELGGRFEDYVKLAEGTPATLMMTGLGQTVAFYLTKKEASDPHYKALLINLASWICQDGGYRRPEQTARRGRTGQLLRDEIIGHDRDRYQFLLDEALEYLIWLKRFAKALSTES